MGDPDLTNYECPDCGGLGIPAGTLRRHKTMCDKCTGLGVWRLEHLPHELRIKILEKQKDTLLSRQKKYLGNRKDAGESTADDLYANGPTRRVNTEIRRERERKTQLDNHFGEAGDKRREAKIIGRLESTIGLKDLKCTVIRCNNAQSQQYEVKITVSTDTDEAKLKLFYKSERKKYRKSDTHYVYIQKKEITTVQTHRRLAFDTTRRLPENYDALCHSVQALARRRLMTRPKSHIGVLERLPETINE